MFVKIRETTSTTLGAAKRLTLRRLLCGVTSLLPHFGTHQEGQWEKGTDEQSVLYAPFARTLDCVLEQCNLNIPRSVLGSVSATPISDVLELQCWRKKLSIEIDDYDDTWRL